MSDSAKRQLIINYVPGEECRVAVMKDGKLDEFHSERASAISHVGNIYVGKVVNVEPSISAAFVDFGLEHNGFLHVSDLHPRYFGGDKGAKERVGKKTPRRERPPIDDALRRGQEIIVQVLKEGVGTKGPTVTSYLSVPGRYLVMMPNMDKVGVSKKVEDEETRAKMKAILDELDLPDDCGFILRTAGLDRTKTELKKDLAYLQRLWKDMEKRRKAGGKPRLLYSESDLLVRALRDMMTAEVDQVIIDSEIALKRAARFVKIVSPRSMTKLIHYKGHTPIFHALNVEPQIRTIYAREVPLPSGGRLVIDEAEALVAIDVNSGKSRSAGDSEQNAYRTNLEAAEEIVRQLRLRDTGGIVVNDLIDMRLAKHRKEVEKRFEDLLAHDRAKSSIAPISDFGILEMTRQRMRGSHESLHFASCPTCHGRGLVQKAESVASDALRELAALLDHAKVARAEMVINPRVGGELLSGKRKALSRIERTFNKPVAIRLSDATPIDRVTLYAYDEQGADIEIDRLPNYRTSDETLAPYVEPGVTDAPVEDEEGWAADSASEREIEPIEPEHHEPLPEASLIETELSPEDLSLANRGSAPGDQGGGQGEGRGRRRRGRRGRGGRGGGGGGGGGGGTDGAMGGEQAPRGHGFGQPHSSVGAAPAVGHSDPDGGTPGSGPDGARGGEAGEGIPSDRPPVGPDGPGFDGPWTEGQDGGGGDGRSEGFLDGPPQGGDQFGQGDGRRRRRRRRGRGRGGNFDGPPGAMQGPGPNQGSGQGQGAAGPGPERAQGSGQGFNQRGPGGPPHSSGPHAGHGSGHSSGHGGQAAQHQRGPGMPQGQGQGNQGGRPFSQQANPQRPQWGPGQPGGQGSGNQYGQPRPPFRGPGGPGGPPGGRGFGPGGGGPRPNQPQRFEGLAGAFRAEALRASQQSAPSPAPAPTSDGTGSSGSAENPPREGNGGNGGVAAEPTASSSGGGPEQSHSSEPMSEPFLTTGREGGAEGGDSGFDASGGDGPDGSDRPEGQGGGRRRRGRRGRGGRGGGGGNGGGPGDAAPPADASRGPAPTESRGGQPNQPPRAPQPPASPSAPGTAAPGTPPRPRLLYSAFRKLKPGEKGSIKREE